MADSTSHKAVHAHFRKIFGPPDSTLGRDDHWALKPGRDGASINVLVNGASEVPAVWVFDPYDANDGVMRALITDEDTLNELVSGIQDRLQRAKKKLKAM